MRVHGVDKRTQRKKKTLSPVWDRTFNFEFHGMKRSELEQAKVELLVIDHNLILPNKIIGAYSIDLTSVYFQENHVFHKCWFALFDPEQDVEGCVGFLRADIEVLGPGDEPTVFEAITDDPSQEKTILCAKIKPTSHLITAEIYRAEGLAPVNILSRQSDSFVRVGYGGVERQTRTVDGSSNPHFNQIVFLSAMLPNHSKFLRLEVVSGSAVSETVLGAAFIPLNTFLNTNDLKPTWVNLYGPLLSCDAKTSRQLSANGAKCGTCYRGRVLVRLSSRNEPAAVSEVVDIDYKPPFFSVPNPLAKVYTLFIDVYEANELPSKTKGILHFNIGPYFLKTDLRAVKDGRINWQLQVPEKKVNFPMDAAQIPDLIVYFADEDAESRRMSYARVPAATFFAIDTASYEKALIPSMVKLREERSHDLVDDYSFPGFLVIRPILVGFTPPPRPSLHLSPNPLDYRLLDASVQQQPPDQFGSNYPQTRNYKLALFVYVARDLASGEPDGTTNPFISFTTNGQTARTKTISRTLNPDFYETVLMDISVNHDPYSPPPALVVLANHQKAKNGSLQEQQVLLGRYWMMLNTKVKKKLVVSKHPRHVVDIFNGKPRWLPLIYDKKNQVDGKLLLGYSLIPAESFDAVKLPSSLKPKGSFQELTLFSVGFRDFVKKIVGNNVDNICYDIKINSAFRAPQSGKQESEDSFMQTNVFSQKLNASHPIRLMLEVPAIKALCPVMEVFLHRVSLLGEKQFLGLAQYPLSKELGFIYGDEEDRDYQQKWNDFFVLDKKIGKAEEKKGPNRPKVRKIKPENKLLYIDHMLYEIDEKELTRGNLNELTPQNIHKQRLLNNSRVLLNEGDELPRGVEAEPNFSDEDLAITDELSSKVLSQNPDRLDFLAKAAHENGAGPDGGPDQGFNARELLEEAEERAHDKRDVASENARLKSHDKENRPLNQHPFANNLQVNLLQDNKYFTFQPNNLDSSKKKSFKRHSKERKGTRIQQELRSMGYIHDSSFQTEQTELNSEQPDSERRRFTKEQMVLKFDEILEDEGEQRELSNLDLNSSKNFSVLSSGLSDKGVDYNEVFFPENPQAILAKRKTKG